MTAIANLTPRTALQPVLTFNLGSQRYGLPVDDVVEVASMVELQTVPDTRPEILGVANWHGTVLPILDLRPVFGHHAEPIGLLTLFIVAAYQDRKIGLVVDEIHQVEYMDSLHLGNGVSAGTLIRGIISYKSELVQIIALAPLLAAYWPDASGQ